jgi:serine protease Do
LEAIAAAYRTPAIGITGISLEHDDYNRAETWGIPPLGVIVSTVPPGHSADRAGIRPHDVITSFDGQPVFTMPQLIEAIRSRKVGDIVEIRILRNGSFALTFDIEIGVLVRENFDLN